MYRSFSGYKCTITIITRQPFAFTVSLLLISMYLVLSTYSTLFAFHCKIAYYPALLDVFFAEVVTVNFLFSVLYYSQFYVLLQMP